MRRSPSLSPFIGNVVSVPILNLSGALDEQRLRLVVAAAGANPGRIAVAGAALAVALYGLMVLAFWRLF